VYAGGGSPPMPEGINLERGVMAQRRMRLTCTATEILHMLAGELEFFHSTYPDLDLALEAHHWAAYHDSYGVVRPRASFIQWLKIAQQIFLKQKQRNNHKELTSDPNEYLRRYGNGSY
jgi:hypothetical protein